MCAALGVQGATLRRAKTDRKPHEPEGVDGPEGAFELERVEYETGGALGPEEATPEELEP